MKNIFSFQAQLHIGYTQFKFYMHVFATKTTTLLSRYVKYEVKLWDAAVISIVYATMFWGCTDFTNTWEWNLAYRHTFINIILKICTI